MRPLRILGWLTLVGIALGVVLALCGCAPDHGTVHGKSYTPAHMTVTVICAGGKSMRCFPLPEYVAAAYSIDVWASRSDHGWVSVDPITYSHVQVGSYWSDGTHRP